MDSVLRAFAIYAFLLIVLRLSGKRTLSDITVFDFVLILIIGEATQQALLGEDFSLTNAALIILTLVGIDLLLAALKQRSARLETVLEGPPLVLVDQGVPLKDRMYRERVSEDDVLEAGRRYHGIQRMDQVKYAVLERHGGITVVPWESDKLEEQHVTKAA